MEQGDYEFFGNYDGKRILYSPKTKQFGEEFGYKYLIGIDDKDLLERLQKDFEKRKPTLNEKIR